jgi:Dolichyl-phosphate-mannose-protein mannosyltransferase
MSAVDVPAVRRTPRTGLTRARLRAPRWSRAAWGAIAIVVLFIAITCWWLTQDGRVPAGDAARHLQATFIYRDYLRHGDFLGPLNQVGPYPPVTFVVGAIAVLIGGVHVVTPIIGANLVYVPLLALGCYQVGRLLAGPLAGLLAVVFALGSPLIIEQFHVFMIDAPEAALVAVTVWLILASDHFSRVGIAALAGVAAGFGTASKEQFPLFIVGLLVVVLLREDGWRNRRGLLAFAAIAFVIAAPWYLRHLSDLGGIISGSALRGPTVPPLADPPLLSALNVEWYLWAALNGLLFAPLFAIAAIGFGSTIATFVRRREATSPAMELLAGLSGAWLALTIVPDHDLRYTIPMIVYIATIGTAWIVRLRWRVARRGAIGALALAVVATTLGATFGVGGRVPTQLPGDRYPPRGEGVPRQHHVTFYANHDFLVSGPDRDGNVLGLFKALHRNGATQVIWFLWQAQEWDAGFDFPGLYSFAREAKLTTPPQFNPLKLRRDQAFIIHQAHLRTAPPCLRLSDGSGIWVRLGNPEARGVRDYCPFRTPAFYGP